MTQKWLNTKDGGKKDKTNWVFFLFYPASIFLHIYFCIFIFFKIFLFYFFLVFLEKQVFLPNWKFGRIKLYWLILAFFTCPRRRPCGCIMCNWFRGSVLENSGSTHHWSQFHVKVRLSGAECLRCHCIFARND